MNLLDHGYCNLIETWGSDERIVESARMSTAKGFLGWGPKPCPDCQGRTTTPDYSCPTCKGTNSVAGDEKLLKYLADHKHATPFEFAGAVFEVQAPIFVFREWHRHRSLSDIEHGDVPGHEMAYNEMSARYTPLPDLNYIPTVERLMVNSKTNKQAGVVAGADVLDYVGAEAFRRKLASRYRQCEEDYQMALCQGVPKELARVLLPVARYSRMRASANLRNWLAFLTLRCSPQAQYEIRVYADAVRSILAEKFPRTLELFSL